MRKNSILAFGNINSNITQVNIDGLSKEEVHQLCLKLINEQMIRLREDAAVAFRSQGRDGGQAPVPSFIFSELSKIA